MVIFWTWSNITDGAFAFIGENQGTQEKQPVSKFTTASAPVVSSGSSSIISNTKMYSAALPQTMLASNSTPVSFITLNRNNRPSFLVFGSSLSSSSTVRPTSAYMINPDLITIQRNESEHQTEHQTEVDASSSVSKPAAVIISLQSNESASSLIASINSTRLAVINPYASQSVLNGEANSTLSSSLAPSVDNIIVVSSSTTTTPLSIALQNDQATSQTPASKTTTTTTTTTIRPNPPPNVGVFNGLSKIGSASIGLGITSAAYAAAALWIPFIGRRKKRSPPSLDVVWKNYDGFNYANDWFINNDYH